MQDSIYIIFIGFGLIWVLMGVAFVIAIFKSDRQEIKLGKWGLIVALPILLPIAIVLIYQVIRQFMLGNFAV